MFSLLIKQKKIKEDLTLTIHLTKLLKNTVK